VVHHCEKSCGPAGPGAIRRNDAGEYGAIVTGEAGTLGWWATEREKRQEFEAVALVHLDSLHNAALRLTGNRAEAEDVVQETFLRAFRSFHRFSPGTNCRAWLFTIMRNAFFNRVRKDERQVLEAEPGAFEAGKDPERAFGPPVEDPEEHYLHSVLHGDVDRALRGLPLVFREAVVLADLEGLSYREIAEVLGCPVGTVMSRLARGRQLLRRALREFAREHGYLKGEG
jgi:RNA polymerase sigma-70 factor (ECF subfamily)